MSSITRWKQTKYHKWKESETNGLMISRLKGLCILLITFYPSNKIEILSLSLSKFETPKEYLFAVNFEKIFIALNISRLYGFMKKSG